MESRNLRIAAPSFYNLRSLAQGASDGAATDAERAVANAARATGLDLALPGTRKKES